MKILIASAANSIHTVRWVNSLSERGIDVSLVYLADHAPQENKISESVTLIPMEATGFFGYFKGCRELRKIYELGDYDFIHAHFASGYGTLVRLAKIKPALLSVWGTDIFGFPKKSWVHRKLIQSNLKYYDVITSTSEVMKEETLKLNRDLKIDVVPFGVDTQFFDAIGLVPHEGIRIAIVKTYLPRYGIKYLIDAVSLVVEHYGKGFDLVLDIYGKGPLESEYIAQIESLDLGSCVCIKGYVENNKLPDILRSYDMFALSSLEESFGVSAIEAMSVGLPVVASDAVGFVEVIEDGVSGLIVEKGNALAMSKAIIRLIDDSDLRESLARGARQRVMDLYDWDKNVDQMIDIYKEVNHD